MTERTRVTKQYTSLVTVHSSFSEVICALFPSDFLHCLKGLKWLSFAMYVLTQLFPFRVTSLVTQCSHFTGSKVFVKQHHGLLSKELRKVGLVGSSAAEEE